MRRAGRFTLIGDQLYKKAFSRPLLKCVSSEDSAYILQEVHQGSCGGHPGGRSLAKKILLAGYFWPTLQADAARTVSTCLSCQKYHNFYHRPAEEMKASTVSCPFDQWGIDIVGPFPMATGQRKFLLVAVDYFSKWVEAEPLAKITEQMVKKFIWQNIICRFSIPRRLISDNGRQFKGTLLEDWCKSYGIEQHFTSVAYPQSNGQAEVANREILRILHARLNHLGGSWVDEVPGVLWAIRTTPKEGTGVTPFHLVYAGEAVIPVEVGVESVRIQCYDGGNAERRNMELDLVDEE
ncbi:hypothetical protein ZIOFF_061759 [Zingiber officinale]|uniref:Integrase catalytic domain-containing protein n=1 Tax=Zingiber officinale TaxID=94328 RepID=A0A8J5EZU9_ZINOF|nr:hypothetical protein ZIOFF_061759 [Zingiber officinale]